MSIRSSLVIYERRWLALHGNTRGAIWILVAGFMTTVQSLMVKQVGDDLHVFQVVFLRCLFGFMLISLLGYTTWASTQQAVWDWQGITLGPDRWWTLATLIDAYFGFGSRNEARSRALAGSLQSWRSARWRCPPMCCCSLRSCALTSR